MEVSIFKVLLITGLHVPICRIFNYDVGRRRRLVTFLLYATDGRFVSSVCMYGGLQASYLVPEMGKPADLTYIHGPWSRRPEESERARETYRTHAPQNTSLVPTTHSQPNTSSSSKCRKQQAFFPYHYPRIVSYLSSGDGDKSEGGSGKKYIDIVSDRELQTPSQACRETGKCGKCGNGMVGFYRIRIDCDDTVPTLGWKLVGVMTV